ncbi:MAG: amidohydrolase [Thermoplasmata archaeon]|jgi:hypothetical protein|nr:amidohydrolase [Thermoplasmata archaeon]
MVARCADAVFYNGRIYTLDPSVPTARAIAVEGGRIVAIGDDATVRGSTPRGAAKYDLGGKAVIPGFIDAHTHFIQMGVDSLSVDLSGTKSVDEALSLMKAAASKTPEGDWVIGTNWRESCWADGRFITGKDLDECCPRHPAVAHRICGHLSSLNRRAVSEVGLNAKTPDVDVDPSGSLTGIVRESAVGLVRTATSPTPMRRAKGLAVATKRAHSLGVTSIHENGTAQDLRVFIEAERSGKLWVRVRFNIPSQHLDSIVSAGLSSGLGSDWLRIGGVKIFCDGALGARSAALSRPFADDPGNKGMFVHERKVLDEMTREANASGMQLVVHAIGDEGIDVAISSIEAALQENPRRDHRHRIEHLELPTRDHIARMRRLGLIASMQPNFVGEWGGINGMYYDRLGPERAARNNPFGEVLGAKVRLAFGSDCMPFSPPYGITSAMRAPHELQRLSAEQAISAYTRDAAFAGFDEGIKGTLTEGKYADFAVLSSDPMAEPETVDGMIVVKTVLNGEVVFDRTVARRRKP